MGQSKFKWAIIRSDGETTVVMATLEELPSFIDWIASDIVAIIRLELE